MTAHRAFRETQCDNFGKAFLWNAPITSNVSSEAKKLLRAVETCAPSQAELASRFFVSLIASNPNVVNIEDMPEPAKDNRTVVVTVKSMFGDDAKKIYEAHAETLRNYPGVALDIWIND